MADWWDQLRRRRKNLAGDTRESIESLTRAPVWTSTFGTPPIPLMGTVCANEVCRFSSLFSLDLCFSVPRFNHLGCSFFPGHEILCPSCGGKSVVPLDDHCVLKNPVTLGCVKLTRKVTGTI